MLLLALHIVSITLLVLLAGAIGYRMGVREGIRRTRQALEEQQEALGQAGTAE